MLALLGQLSKNQTGIRLLNIFKGLPVNYDASIRSADDFEICITTSRYQLACLYHQRETYLQANQLPDTIRAQVISLNLAREEAVLANFELAPNTIGNRMNIRVEPGDELIGMLQVKGFPTKIAAPIADISIFGTSFFIDGFLFPVRFFQPGNEIGMTISFPVLAIKKPKNALNENRNTRNLVRSSLPVGVDGKLDIYAWGKVLSVRPDLARGRYRVSIKFYIKDPERLLVSQYISMRQAEIIKELQLLTNELFKRTV